MYYVFLHIWQCFYEYGRYVVKYLPIANDEVRERAKTAKNTPTSGCHLSTKGYLCRKHPDAIRSGEGGIAFISSGGGGCGTGIAGRWTRR